MHEARAALRAGDLTVEGSQRYSAWDSDLYQADAWAQRRDAWYAERELPHDGEVFLMEWLDQLHRKAHQVSKRIAQNKNQDARVEKEKLILTPLEKIELPPGVREARTDLVRLFPSVGLPEVLLDVERRAHYTRELTHLTGRRASSAEREAATRPAVFAVLVAETAPSPLFGMRRGVTLYNHVNNRGDQYWIDVVNCLLREATYVLDGLLYQDAPDDIDSYEA